MIEEKAFFQPNLSEGNKFIINMFVSDKTLYFFFEISFLFPKAIEVPYEINMLFSLHIEEPKSIIFLQFI